MKKNFKFYVAIWAVLLVLFNVIAFLSVGWKGYDKYTASFWIGYTFITVAFLGQLLCAWKAFGTEDARKMFYNVSLITTSWTGLILSFVFGGLCMLISPLPYWVGVILCAIVLAANVMAVLKAAAAVQIVSEMDDKIATQTFFIKSLTVDAESLIARAKDLETKAVCKKVYEAVRYSDPMSRDELAGIEGEIETAFGMFKQSVVENGEVIQSASKELLLLIENRNRKCRFLHTQPIKTTIPQVQRKPNVRIIIAVVGAFALTVFVAVTAVVIVPIYQYNKGIQLMDAEKYEAAIEIFEGMRTYKDSEEKITLCEQALLEATYNNAVAALGRNEYIVAYELFDSLNTYKDSLSQKHAIKAKYQISLMKNAAVGSTVLFGNYEQDNQTENGTEDIEWYVVAKENNKLLLLSKYALDCQPYHTAQQDVTWRDSTVRIWLNQTFKNKAFSAEETSKLLEICTQDESAKDYIFLLNKTQFQQYVSNNLASCVSTEYAKKQGVHTVETFKCSWWLRDDDATSLIPFVGIGGLIDANGDHANSANNAVRPAMWIDLNA